MAINWQEIITQFLTTVGGAGVLLAAAVWLIRALVSDRLARDSEAFKVQLKVSADREIERVKAFLIRSSRVHERQLDILQNLYRSLYEAQGFFQRMTSSGRFKDEISSEAYGEKVAAAMQSALNELMQGRLLIPSPLAQQCDSFFNAILKGRLTFSFANEPILDPTKRAESWMAAARIAHEEVPKILAQIEQAARAVIHGEPPEVYRNGSSPPAEATPGS
jgi:hypothetical protein